VDSERPSFADYVRRTRVANRQSLEDVRRESGLRIAASYVNKIESDEIKPEDISLGKLLSLAKGLGVSADELLDVARGVVSRQVEVSEELLGDRTKRAELMKLVFLDIPDDCQLDSLASLLGLHSRRGISLRIHQRSDARAAALSKISQLVAELFPASARPAAPTSVFHPDAEVKAPLPDGVVLETPASILALTERPGFSLTELGDTSSSNPHTTQERKQRAS
jgi:transcriptional regulator with XRE-family HTH domain